MLYLGLGLGFRVQGLGPIGFSATGWVNLLLALAGGSVRPHTRYEMGSCATLSTLSHATSGFMKFLDFAMEYWLGISGIWKTPEPWCEGGLNPMTLIRPPRPRSLNPKP